MIFVTSERPVIIRAYQHADTAGVVDLFIRINRELAPIDMREQFEQYIQTSIDGEMSRLADVFSSTKRNAFWVVEADGDIIGMFGIESRSDESTELRRMYLDRRYRGCGIAQRMLQCAETRARELGFVKLILSTAEVQRAAIAFYRRSGYRLVRHEQADTMSTRTVGGGLRRFHFEKVF
jgi:putative acetyltransferase